MGLIYCVFLLVGGVGACGDIAGGEVIGAVIYTTESTFRSRRGMYGGLVLGMALLGIFLGSAVATTVK